MLPPFPRTLPQTVMRSKLSGGGGGHGSGVLRRLHGDSGPRPPDARTGSPPHQRQIPKLHLNRPHARFSTRVATAESCRDCLVGCSRQATVYFRIQPLCISLGTKLCSHGEESRAGYSTACRRLSRQTASAAEGQVVERIEFFEVAGRSLLPPRSLPWRPGTAHVDAFTHPYPRRSETAPW